MSNFPKMNPFQKKFLLLETEISKLRQEQTNALKEATEASAKEIEAVRQRMKLLNLPESGEAIDSLWKRHQRFLDEWKQLEAMVAEDQVPDFFEAKACLSCGEAFADRCRLPERECSTCKQGLCENCLLEANRLFAGTCEQHPDWKTCAGQQDFDCEREGCHACFQGTKCCNLLFCDSCLSKHRLVCNPPCKKRRVSPQTSSTTHSKKVSTLSDF